MKKLKEPEMNTKANEARETWSRNSQTVALVMSSTSPTESRRKTEFSLAMAVMDMTGSWKEEGVKDKVFRTKQQRTWLNIGGQFVDLRQRCHLQWPKEHG